jgi:hypothetical protein
MYTVGHWIFSKKIHFPAVEKITVVQMGNQGKSSSDSDKEHLG